MRSKTMLLRIPVAEHSRLKTVAQYESRPMTEVLQEAMDDYFMARYADKVVSNAQAS